VHAGIDHQTNRPPDVSLQPAVIRVWILVEADVLAEPLGVKPPTLDVCGVKLVLAKCGSAIEFLGDGDLKVMAWQALVVGNGLDAV